MADLEEKKIESGDKVDHKIDRKLAAGNTEADITAHRAVLNANPDKRTTMSPEGSTNQPFGITDGGKIIASKDTTQQEFYGKFLKDKGAEAITQQTFQPEMVRESPDQKATQDRELIEGA